MKEGYVHATTTTTTKNSFTKSLEFKGDYLASQSDFFEYKCHSQYRVEFKKKRPDEKSKCGLA